MRHELNAMTLDDLIDRTLELGLDTSEIDVRNKRRVIRLIENNGVMPTKGELRRNTLIIGLHVPADDLRANISSRVDHMFQAGLESEVLRLSTTFGWDVEPMKGIGYREFHEYFIGSQTRAETRQRIVNDSLNLAKRQRTWFKRNNRIHWIDEQAEAVDLVTTFLNK